MSFTILKKIYMLSIKNRYDTIILFLFFIFYNPIFKKQVHTKESYRDSWVMSIYSLRPVTTEAESLFGCPCKRKHRFSHHINCKTN